MIASTQLRRTVRRGAVVSCALAACLLLVAGCGTAPADGGRTPTTGPAGLAGGFGTDGASGSPARGYPCIPASGSGHCGSPSAGAPGAPQVSLQVIIYGANDPAAQPAPARYTLYCEPDGGTVPDPAAACAELLADTDLFAPQPVGVACPMIMVDASQFVVEGTYLGRQVDETIADGGCDLQRWAELRQIFG